MPHGFLVALLAALFALPLAHAGESTFSEPRAGLHTGGQPSERQLEDLAGQGGQTVIDLRGADEKRGYDEPAAAARLKLRYVSLPIADANALTAANAIALKQALDASEGPVLLHCASGNRVGALLALMAAGQEDMDAPAALAFGQRAGLKSLEPVVRTKLGMPPAQPAR